MVDHHPSKYLTHGESLNAKHYMSNYGPLDAFFLVMFNILDTRRIYILDVISSTLPLNERDILKNYKIIPKVYIYRLHPIRKAFQINIYTLE